MRCVSCSFRSRSLEAVRLALLCVHARTALVALADLSMSQESCNRGVMERSRGVRPCFSARPPRNSDQGTAFLKDTTDRGVVHPALAACPDMHRGSPIGSLLQVACGILLAHALLAQSTIAEACGRSSCGSPLVEQDLVSRRVAQAFGARPPLSNTYVVLQPRLAYVHVTYIYIYTHSYSYINARLAPLSPILTVSCPACLARKALTRSE